MNRRKKLGVIAAAAGILLLTPVTVLAEDKWESKNGGRYRVKEDGTYYAGEWFSVTNNPSRLQVSRPLPGIMPGKTEKYM